MIRQLYCGDFPQLQVQFVSDVSVQRQADPLAPLVVLVPGQLVRLALRRELAWSGCSHANVRFVTLIEFAQERVPDLFHRRGLRILPDVARGPLMKHAVDLAYSRLTYFADIANRRGFRDLIWRTLDELRSAGITAEHLMHSAERMHGSMTATLRMKVSDLALIGSTLLQLMVRQKYVDHIELLLLACRLPSAPDDAPVLLYGFDHLTHLEKTFLTAAAAQRLLSVYLPYRSADSHAWARPLFEYFCGQRFEPHFIVGKNAGDDTLLEHVQRGLFGGTAQGPRPTDASDHSLILISAPGRDREAEEVTREVMFSPVAETHPHRRIGVLLPRSERYAELLRNEFSRAGFSGYIHACRTLGDRPSGRALRLLTSLLDLRFTRIDVMEFILSCPLRRPVAFPEALSEIPSAEWNQFSLLAGISFGETSWSDGLRRLRNRMMSEAHGEDNDEAGPSSRQRQVVSLDAFRDYFSLLFTRLRAIRAARSWRTKCERLWTAYDDWVERDEEGDAIAEELARAAELDHLGIPPDHETFVSMMETILARPAAREGRFQIHEPTVASFSEAMGVVFDEVMIPGLVERELPRPPSHDPLLLDDERELLEVYLAKSGQRAEIPRRARERDRERFLFASALSSARWRLVLLYPRLDPAENREQLPSSFLLHVLEAATGTSADYESVEDFIAAGTHARRVPIRRLDALASGRATGEQQYKIGQLGEALRTGSVASIADLLQAGSPLLRGARAEQARFHAREFTRYDGVIEDSALGQHYGDWGRAGLRSLSPTRMETYAACPFRFFALHVLELTRAEEPPGITRLEALERGDLIHRILETFYRREQQRGRLPLQPDAGSRLQETAEEWFDRFERERPCGLPMLWQVERRRIQQWLLEFFERELDDASGFIPLHFEMPYGQTASAEDSPKPLPEVTLPDGTSLRFSGRMDRVDISPDGRARVIDYKTGKEKSGYHDGNFCGGQALQLPVYRLAAEAMTGLRTDYAAYYYLTDRAKRRSIRFTLDHWQRGQPVFAAIVATISRGIAEGLFYPYPSPDHCRHCPVRTACGSGRHTFKWLDPPPSVQAYLQMIEERW